MARILSAASIATSQSYWQLCARILRMVTVLYFCSSCTLMWCTFRCVGNFSTAWPNSTWCLCSGFLGTVCGHAVQSMPQLRARRTAVALPSSSSGLDPVSRDKVLQSNTEVEVVSWFAQQCLRCRRRSVGLVPTFPEDIEVTSITDPRGHCWNSAAWKAYMTLGEALASYASSLQPYIAVFCCDCPGPPEKLDMDSPILPQCGDTLHHDGPLSKRCPCTQAHSPMGGLTVQEDFHLAALFILPHSVG